MLAYYDYNDRYYLPNNPNQSSDTPLSKSGVERQSVVDLNDLRNEFGPSHRGVYKHQLRRLYALESSREKRLFEIVLARVAHDLYPLVLEQCSYKNREEKRVYMTGGTPALKQAMTAFREFVDSYETGVVSLLHVDNVIYACHNNGVLADIFILDSPDEYDAIEFLNELSGIKR